MNKIILVIGMIIGMMFGGNIFAFDVKIKWEFPITKVELEQGEMGYKLFLSGNSCKVYSMRELAMGQDLMWCCEVEKAGEEIFDVIMYNYEGKEIRKESRLIQIEEGFDYICGSCKEEMK